MADVHFHPKDPSTWIPRDLFALYCGEGSEKLLAYYDKAVSKKKLPASFNLFALLLYPAWLGYRGQWLLWFTFTALFGVLPFVEYGFGFHIPNGAFVGIGLTFGMMAQGFLLSQATGQYVELLKEGHDDEKIAEALRDRAAPSIPSAIFGLVASVGIVFAAEWLAATLLG